MRNRISQIVFDRKAGEYADIPPRCGQHWMHLSVHEGMRLGLGTDSVPAHIWYSIVSAILAARLGLIMSGICLAKVMQFLVGAMNPAPTPRPLWPDVRLIQDVIKSTPMDLWASKADYLKTLINALDGLMQQSGPLLQTFRGLDVNRDIIDKGRSVVIDMSNLFPAALRSIVVDLILAQILFTRIHQQRKVDTTEVVVVIDEADQDVSRGGDAAFADGMSVVGQVLKQGRELGIMAVIGLTVMGEASRYVLSGPQYHLIFNQSDAESMIEARRTLALRAGSEQMFPALPSGRCIFRQAQLSWAHPMLCHVDYIPPCRTDKTAAYDTHPYIPSKRLSELRPVEKALDERIAEHMKLKSRQARRHSAGLSANAHKLLELAALNPHSPVARLWERVGRPSKSVQGAARRQLEQYKLADFEEVRIGRTNVLLIAVLRAGWRLLHKTPPSRTGRGGIAHRHFAHWIAQLERRRGYEAKCEWCVPGTTHPAGVASKHGSTWHAYEVCVTATDNIFSHIEACLGSPAVSQITIVTSQLCLRDKMRKSLPGELFLGPDAGRISFEVIDPYMKELFQCKP